MGGGARAASRARRPPRAVTLIPRGPYDREVAHAIDWERAAAGWGANADRVRAHGMPVSMWMLDSAALQPGERVLELAAGPGDTGFLAAELVSSAGA